MLKGKPSSEQKPQSDKKRDEVQNVKLQRIFPFDLRDKIGRGDVNEIARSQGHEKGDIKRE
jgi:hypothetical protein